MTIDSTCITYLQTIDKLTKCYKCIYSSGTGILCLVSNKDADNNKLDTFKMNILIMYSLTLNPSVYFNLNVCTLARKINIITHIYFSMPRGGSSSQSQ